MNKLNDIKSFHFFLDECKKLCEDSDNMKNQTLKLNNETAESLRHSAEKLRSERDQHIALAEELDATLQKIMVALGEVEPPSKFRIKDEVANDGYSDRDRINAVIDAFAKVGVPKGQKGFGKRDIFQIVFNQHPKMFRNSKDGKTLFSNIFWRVIRDLIKQHKVTEVEPGGGRKPTLFAKI